MSFIRTLFHENCFLTDFKERAKLFSFFFSKQCSLIPNNYSLPANVNYITEKRLSTIKFSVKDVRKIIQNLDSSNAHGHDYINTAY